MSVTLERPRLEPHVTALLARLRAQIRRYVVIEGTAATLATLGASWWVCLALDWVFEPSPALRRTMLAAGAVATIFVFYRLVVRRLAVPWSDPKLALLLERRFGIFNDSLLTSVDMTQSDRELGELAAAMLEHTCHQAARQAERVHLSDVFRTAPLARAGTGAALVLSSMVVFALAAPDTMRFAVSRLTGATSDPWPRQVALVAQGFDSGERVVARGDNVELLVQADLSMPRVPDVVQLRYVTEEGVRGRETMTRSGNALADGQSHQEFRHTFANVLSSLSFDVFGGDARLRDLRIRVVDSPTITSAVLACEFPAYMNRSPRDLPVTGTMQVPLGTQITIRATANKDLVRAALEWSNDAASSHQESIDIPGAGGNLRDFQFSLPPLVADTTLAFTLSDTDGIQNRKPFLVSLVAVADEPPTLSVQLRGIGTAITPLARLPLVGKIVDDYGVAEAGFLATVDDQEPRPKAFATAPAGQAEVEVDEAYDARELKLKPGQKLLFGAQARDAFHLTPNDQPHTAHSERFQLDVVSPETLRAMLESRELNLRQRYESIIAEVTETRDSLAAPAATSDTKSEKDEASADQDAAQPPAETQDTGPARLTAERARQNADKDAQEITGVATAFDDIREELVNNRVDTEELKIRLKDHIADPLRLIVGQQFPEWDRRLKTLLDKPADPSARRDALEQADAILVELARVRDRMLELESFNEAIDMLRAIISAEKSLQEQVRERQKRKVSDLLEDSE